jgi:hypothetical protein
VTGLDPDQIELSRIEIDESNIQGLGGGGSSVRRYCSATYHFKVTSTQVAWVWNAKSGNSAEDGSVPISVVFEPSLVPNGSEDQQTEGSVPTGGSVAHK